MARAATADHKAKMKRFPVGLPLPTDDLASHLAPGNSTPSERAQGESEPPSADNSVEDGGSRGPDPEVEVFNDGYDNARAPE